MISIVWVNYNSMGIMDVVLKSLKSILELDYPEYEVIVVDNASSDGSFERIREFIEKLKVGRSRDVKLLRLPMNRGYAGGLTEGFRIRDRGSKYVIAMNNDVIVLPDALKALIELAETRENVGAVNGVLVSYWKPTNVIDSAGGILNEILTSGSLFSGWNVEEYKVRKPYPVAFTDGPLALYNVKAVLDANNGLEILYDPWTIAYNDDVLISLKLWNKGYKCIVYPRIIGWHGRSLTFKKLSLTVSYLTTRNRVALNEITNSKFKSLIRILMVKRILRYPRARLAKAYMVGLRLGGKLKRLGLKIDLYKAPIAPILRREAMEALLGRLSSVNVKATIRFEREILKAYS